jgi:hypothetical protein
MRSYPNIETKSWKRRGSDNAPLYIGYAHGTVWYCARSGRSWRADCIARDFHKIDGSVAIHADTLRELSEKLEAVKLRGVA